MIAQVKPEKSSPLILAQEEMMRQQPKGPYKVNGRGEGIQSWGFVKEGRARSHRGMPCCAQLTHNKVVNPEAFFIYQEAPITDTVRDYIGWLMGPQSPWIKLVQAQPEQDFEFILKYGFVMTNLEFPANYIVTFMKCWRQPLEFVARISVWHEAVKLGAHPSVAGYLTDMAYLDGKSVALTTSSGHGWAHPYYAGVDVFNNLFTGEYSKKFASPHSFKSSQSYYPCDQVWGYSDNGSTGVTNLKPGAKSLYQMATDFASKHKSDEKIKQRFLPSKSDQAYTYPKVTVEQWAEFCKLMQKEAEK